jgi:hypothetical protein
MLERITDESMGTTPAQIAAAAAPSVAPEASPASQAYAAMQTSIGRKPLDASSMAAAIEAAWKCRDDEGLAMGQAALTIQMQHDLAVGAAGEDPLDTAVKELEAEHLPSLDFPGAQSLEKAAQAMRAGAGSSTAGGATPVRTGDRLPPSASAIKQAVSQLNAYLSAGVKLPEALSCVSTEDGGIGCDGLTLACAALFVQAPASLQAYLRDPTGPTPVRLARATLTQYFDAATLDQATDLMAATEHTGAFDEHAVSAALTKLAADQEGSIDYTDDMTALRTALTDALDAQSGKQGIAWMADPLSRDTLDQAEAAVVHQAFASVSSASSATQQSASHNLTLALTELQTLGEVQGVTFAHHKPDSAVDGATQSDVAKTNELTAQLESLGLLRIDPTTQALVAPSNPYAMTRNSAQGSLDDWTLYNDITRDASIVQLKTDDLNEVIGAAGSASSESAQAAQADLRATSGLLAEFKSGGAFNYQDLLAGALQSAPVRQRFVDLAGSVHAKHAIDEVHADAQILKNVGAPADADLAVALYQDKFQSRFEGLVAHGVWNNGGGLSILWGDHNDAPRYAADVGDAYAALGDTTTPAGQTAAGRRLLGAVKTRMDGNDFVGTGGGSEKNYDLNWTSKGGTHIVNPQLYQDIVDAAPHSSTAKFIEEELPTLSHSDAAPPPEAAAANAASPSTRVVTSRAALIDALGSAYNQTPLPHPAPGEPHYDGNDKAYGDKTLNQIADGVTASQHIGVPSDNAPLELTTLPMLYWSEAAQKASRADKQADPQTLPLIEIDGAAGRKFIGPGNPKAFDSYDAWVRNNGLGKGTLLSQQYLTTDRAGMPVNVWDQTATGPKKPMSNLDIFLKAGEAMVLFPAVGALSVAPFAAPMLATATGGVLRLAYLGTRIYFAGAATWNAGSAIKNVATHPTSWRAWAVGGAVTAVSVAPYAKGIGALTLGGTTPALTSASSEDPVLSQIMAKIGDKRPLVVGGFSGTGYADVDRAVQAWTADLQREIETHGAENLIVVSGATSDGIGDIAYSVAKAHGVDTLGIVSEEARQFGVSPYVDDVVFVPDPGKTWSTIAPDGQSYMVSAAAIYYGYGGGEIARDELIEAQQRGIPTVIYGDFGPDPASKQLLSKLAKNPNFDQTPVKTAIDDGRLRGQQLP